MTEIEPTWIACTWDSRHGSADRPRAWLRRTATGNWAWGPKRKRYVFPTRNEAATAAHAAHKALRNAAWSRVDVRPDGDPVSLPSYGCGCPWHRALANREANIPETTWNVGDLCTCTGEGNAVFVVEVVDSKTKPACVFLSRLTDANHLAGWKSTHQCRRLPGRVDPTDPRFARSGGDRASIKPRRTTTKPRSGA